MNRLFCFPPAVLSHYHRVRQDWNSLIFVSLQKFSIYEFDVE